MYYPKYEGDSMSITVALQAVGENNTSSLRIRKIAVANGMPLYVGTSKQKNTLLSLLKEGLLVMP